MVVDVDDMPASLVVLHAESLLPGRIVPLKDRRGQALKVASIVEIGHRQSVPIGFGRSSELWEMFLAADAEPVFEGMVHDYRLGEGISEPRTLPIRRMVTEAPMEHFTAERSGALLSQLTESSGGPVARRFNLDARRLVVEQPIPANLDPGAAVGVRTERTSFWLSADRDWPGIHVHELPGMNYRGFVELPGEHCRVLSSPTVQSRFIVACASGGMDQLFTIDDATLATHAICSPALGRASRKLRAAARLVTLLPW